MFRLIKNEHVKLLKRRVTFVSLVLIAAFQFLFALVTKRILAGAGAEDHFIGYFSFAPNLNILLQGLSVAVAASIISFEYDKKTIKFLLIRPVSREKILISKFLTSVFASIWLFFVYYGFSLLYGLVFFGIKLDPAAKPLFLNTLQIIGSQWLEVFMMVSFAFLCSALFRSSALSIMVSIVVLYGAKALVTIMAYLQNPWGKFLLFANTDFTQYGEHAKSVFAGMTPLFSVIIIIIHFVFFIGVAWWSFCKRDVKI